MKKVPSQLIKDQESGKSIIEQFPKPKITQFLNIVDNSIYPDAQVSVDEPLFQPVPHVIQFTNYEPLQIKEQVLKLRNKDKVARSVKIIPPDSKLFQVLPCKKGGSLGASTSTGKSAATSLSKPSDVDIMSSRVAPGMEISFVIKFSPEAKIDYSYDLMVVTEREKFVVPIRAVGCRAMIDFPDALDFGLVPVKHTAEKPVMIRNIGEKTTKWHIKVPNGFKINKGEGILEVGQSEQLVFSFIPQESRPYKDEVTLLYDKLEAAVPILGESHNDNVYLSKTHIHMEPTSITLYSHQYYQIVNKSSVPVEFSWRAFATEREENEKKARLNLQLSQEEAEERMILEESNLEESMAESLNSDDSYDEDELNKKQERAQQKAIATLARKYQSIRKAVDEDLMLFQDEIFSIEPLQGKIWPNTEITCCVTFKPQGPYHYSCTSFCNITCSEERLPLNMTGQGKGPQAQLSITEMDIGDIFVNYQNEFDVGIENTGEIDCHWKLIPYETPFGSKFHFSKTEGVLGVKEKSRDLIRVTFKSDILGEFSETFRFALEGSSEMLTLTFKGHVVAPTFKFSEEIIDFGKVSYKFPVYKTVHLTNTSDVEINYVVRVPGDGRSLQTEFNITNDRGRLEKNKEAQITIEFIPCFPQQYDMVLVVDLEGVGQDMLAVPIKAECLVPKVRVVPSDFLEYDQCFLRHPKTRKIEIINDDSLKAKYEIVAQDDQSKRIAVYSADQESGIINPKSSQVVNITLKTEILSNIRIPLYIKIEGYHIPFMVTILANSIGPIVSVNKVELDYGNVDVLRDYVEKIMIKNESKIPAEYTAFTKNKESVWKVIQRHGVLKPDDEKEVEVVCNADEVQKFQDTLHIIVNNGVDLEVALRAKGCGSTLFCKENLNVVDFGTEYTHNNITKEFFLENRGRKQMKIQWQRTTKMDRKNLAKKQDGSKSASDSPSKKSGTGGGNDASVVSTAAGNEKDEEVKFVYAVVPDQIVLNPKMGIMVQFRANSFNIGKILESWACNVVVGGDRKPKTVYNTTVSGEFITPQLIFSEAKLYFKYLWEKGVPSMPISKTLDIQNGGPLPTAINLLIDPPFSCATEKLTLAPQRTESVMIKFDPGMKQDRLSDNITGKLSISHIGHPQKDVVNLQGEVCFPNLNIVPPNIDFGCILNDTSKKKYLTLTNISEMAVNYEWSFLEEEITTLNALKQDEDRKTKKKKKQKMLPINEVFDILPVSGVLLPGQTETVEFTYYSGHGLTYNGIAVCSVDGGPEYEVPIIGESSFVSYKLSANELDYGEIPYNESSSKEFFIENIGKVPFQFNINLSTVSRPGLVECHPMTGKVAAGERYKVVVKFFPGIPDNIDEMFLVECAHFPAQRFKVKAVGTYPGCLLSFPRTDDDEFSRRYEETKKLLNKGKVTYTALFSSSEAMKQMPPLPKAVEKDRSLLKEPFVMDVEAEVDRRLLCDKILTQIDLAQAKQAMASTAANLAVAATMTADKLGGAAAEAAGTSQTNPHQNKRLLGNKSASVAQKKGALAKSQGGFYTSIGDEKSLIQPLGGATLGIGGSIVNLENICIAAYACDFGNVVVGSTKKKSFRLTNVGKIPVTFNLDKKILTSAGISIEPDKAQKVLPNSSVLFNVVYSTRKNAKFGKVKHVVPIDVKYGPSYAIEFSANLTIPELAMSSDSLDFGKVCVNTRKTIKVRFENQKEVPCDWSYYFKPDVATAATVAKEGERFQIVPQNGTLLPGQRQAVDVMFTPNSDKPFAQKLTFKCKDNPKQFVLNVKGQGVNYQVDFIPETVRLGPVLPYSSAAVACIEMRNPMDQPIEVYSLDFDRQFIEEEEILKRLDQFSQPPVQGSQQPSQQQQATEPLFLPIRVPGAQFWAHIRKQDERKRKLEDLRKRQKAIEDQLALLAREEQQKEQQESFQLAEGHFEKKASLVDQRAQLDSKILEEESGPLEAKYPPAVKEKDKLHLALIGPEKTGKTTVANYLAQEHQRTVVKLDQLQDFCLKRGLPVGEKAAKYLEQRHEELVARQLEEAERLKKNKGKKPPKGQEEPEINPLEYKYLTKDLLIEMINSRLLEEDCNAGAIFDSLESPNWPSLKFALECLCEALPTQNLQVLLFNFAREQVDGQEASSGEQPLIDEPKGKAPQNQLKNAQGARSKEEEKKLAAAPAQQRGQPLIPVPPSKTLESQEDLQEQEPKEEGHKDEPRPKHYTKEEQEHYQRYAEEITNLFAELTLRQMSGAEEAHAASALTEGELREGEVHPGSAGHLGSPTHVGRRILVETLLADTISQVCEDAKKLVPEPIWPDPDKEPLPPPVIHQIVKKPPNRSERQPITLFSIWTPKEGVQLEDNTPTQLSEQLSSASRWVLNPKETKKLYIKFFSKTIGSFDQVLQFEIVGSYRPFNLTLNATCEFPTINSNQRNVFMAQKKSRPALAPDSYLQKCFVVSENVFDFGPLLIGKDAEKRHNDEAVKKVNSSVFQISNNGKYEVQGTFTLRSSLPAEEGGPGEKSPFMLESDSMELKVDETKNLTVYAFPDQAKLYKDEVICLLKDNPNPVIFSVQCLGAKPVVEVDQDVVEFDRLLLEKKLTKTLTLKNVCAIPIKWKLSGIEGLPEEFQVSKGSGLIKPCKDETVEITFTAKKEQRFNPKLTLEVEDTEGFNIRQESKVIELRAEAFKISLDIRFSHDQILDFEAVRVGEPKENKLYLKNVGMYPVKYSFSMKKKQTREIFTIEPMEGELQPSEEKNVIVKFMSQKEIKLRTTKNTSDITLNILEGKSQETHNSIPINVNVNAVFSKYSITPLKNINFGPMQYGEQAMRAFEVRNEGLFEFKFALCDYKDEEAKRKIKEERQRELEERIKGLEEKKEEVKDPKKKPEPAKAAPKKGDPKAKDAPPEGGLLEVAQYSITPASGAIPPGSAAVISVTFKAKGAKFYESALALDVSNRDPADQPEGIPFELCAESSIPGINTEDVDQIFEEQTVIPSLDPSLNTQTVIQASLFALQERVFWFGTLIAAKNTEGAKERFKIMNPNKIPCTVKFSVKPRSQSKSEGFAFDVKPDVLTIDPHKHKYVTVGFLPTNMQSYGGVFEASVENGDPTSKTGKLSFELRGEGTLPTLQIEKPRDIEADGTPALRFRKTRVGKESTLSLVLKNEGSIAATARFDAIKNDCFSFLGNLNHTITPKTYQAFDISFVPKAATTEKFLLTFNTQHNPFEQHKVLIIGEGYMENVTFEGLPENLEDELVIGDCIVNKAKSVTFSLVNSGDRTVKFRWNQGDRDEFRFYPSVGHLQGRSSKQIKIAFRSGKSVRYDKIDLVCETLCIEQRPDPETGAKYRDWDDTMKTVRMVRPSEHRKVMKQREDEERKRKEEAEAAALAAQAKKPGGKPPAKPSAKDEPKAEELAIDMSEEPTVELIETIAEIEFSKIEGSEKAVPLKTSLVCDYARYECSVKNIDFKATLMYASRSYKFSLKNTSLITLGYNFKIANCETGILDAGPYSIIPKKGTIAPGCDDNFIVKFSPVEVEHDFARYLSANIEHLHPDQEPLIIEANGIAERPIVHFELPPSTFKERREKDMVPIDSKFKIIEFDSLGTNIKNTKRFMAVNPTSQGYEFEWEEIPDENKKLKPMFKCLTQKGVILSGKKFEILFEYTPDYVGEHESYWLFKIPSEKIVQHFMVVGRVVEPNVLFESGKIKFGPLLLDGKNREVVNLINQESIPFSFNFTKESVRGSPDFGDSLRVSPMSGVVPAQSQIPIEVLFQPKFELTYNYNLQCNVKRKARPIVLNVKGEGYKIHHSVFADINRVQVQNEPFKFEFGDFFINERKSKTVFLQNNGEFNFDYVWKRQINKYITVTPETGTVNKGSEVAFEITYLPLAEHQLKAYKVSLNIVSGPKYDFLLNGNARKPGVKLSFSNYDFGPCFVMRQPMPKKALLEITNFDSSAITVEIANFERKPYLDVQLAPGQVLLPSTKDAPVKLEVPIIFTPREIKKYQETITFDFNNLYTIDVVVNGEGIAMMLELVDPDQAVVDFGIVSVGGDVTKTVQLVNKSKKPVTFQLQPNNQEQFKKCCVQFTPEQECTLKPREQMPIEIRYSPKQRMPNFNLELLQSIKDNESKQLLQILGVSHGIEIKLMDEVIAFGSVVKMSRLTKLLQLSNFGDVKAYFKWDSKAYSRFFTIAPESGYVNPNSNLDLEVTFHPSAADPDIRCSKVKCEIKGGDPVYLTLMGKCVEQDTSSTQTINFNTVVRKASRQEVAIKNSEDREWVINPTISTVSDACQGYFAGKQTLLVPARGQATYEIVYNPKTMTKKNAADQFDTHQGSLFFPLPNGTAMLYNLVGIAAEPDAEALPVETVQAKKAKVIIIPVRNWLKTFQRFKVTWVIEGDKDQTTFVKGANMLDLGGESSKEFKLNFLAYKSGAYKVKISFMNESSGEYLSYNLSVQVTDPDLIERIELVSAIRESIAKVITIENPTDSEIILAKSQFSCNNEYIEINPDQLRIPPRSERGFEINYRPLIQCEQEVDLVLKNPILGDFKYKLLLKGLPATAQRSMAFRCALGADLVQAFKFTHYLKKPATYSIKVEKLDQAGGLSDFKSEAAQVQAPAADSAKGAEISVNVKYEPFTIGDSRAILKLTSPEGMEYSCLLFGKSTAPLPQGPIKCVPGAKPVGVDFKNPLNEKCEFQVTFDNANFSLASKLPGPIDPGKVTNLQIKYDAKAELPSTGRMIVTTKGLPPWIYYLQGE